MQPVNLGYTGMSVVTSKSNREIWQEQRNGKMCYCVDTGIIFCSIQTFATKQEALAAYETVKARRNIWCVCIFVIGSVCSLLAFVWLSGLFDQRTQKANTDGDTSPSSPPPSSHGGINTRAVSSILPFGDQTSAQQRAVFWPVDSNALFSGGASNITVTGLPLGLFYSNGTSVLSTYTRTGFNLGNCIPSENMLLCNGAGAFLFDISDLSSGPRELKRVILSTSTSQGSVIDTDRWQIASAKIDGLNFKQIQAASVISSIDPLGSDPNDVVAIPNSRYMVIAGGSDNTFSVADKESSRIVKSIPTGAKAQNALVVGDRMLGVTTAAIDFFKILPDPAAFEKIGTLPLTGVQAVMEHQNHIIALRDSAGLTEIDVTSQTANGTYPIDPSCTNLRSGTSDDTYLYLMCLDRVLIYEGQSLGDLTLVDSLLIPAQSPTARLTVNVDKGRLFITYVDTFLIATTPHKAIIGSISELGNQTLFSPVISGCDEMGSCAEIPFTVTVTPAIRQLIPFPRFEAIVGKNAELQLTGFSHINGYKINYFVSDANGLPITNGCIPNEQSISCFAQQSDTGLIDWKVTAADVFGSSAAARVEGGIGTPPTILVPILPPFEGFYDTRQTYTVLASTFSGSNLQLSVVQNDGQNTPPKSFVSWIQDTASGNLIITFEVPVQEPKELSLRVVATTPEGISTSVPLQATFLPQTAPTIRQNLATIDVETGKTKCITVFPETYFSHLSGTAMQVRFLTRLKRTSASPNLDGSWTLCASPTSDDTGTFANGKIRYELAGRPVGTPTNTTYTITQVGEFDVVGRSKTEYAILVGSFTSLFKNVWWLLSTLLFIPLWNAMVKRNWCCIKVENLPRNTTQFSTSALGFYSLTYAQNGHEVPSGDSGGPRINVLDQAPPPGASRLTKIHAFCCKRDYQITHTPSSPGRYEYFVRGPLSMIFGVVRVEHNVLSDGIELQHVATASYSDANELVDSNVLVSNGAFSDDEDK